MSNVTGLFLVDGGKLFDDSVPSLNRITFYRTALLPSFGLTLPGMESRLNASGWNYFANMSRDLATGFSPIFVDRPATFIPRGTLTNQVTGDITPVLVINWASGDMGQLGDYALQFRAEKVSDATRAELFPIIDLGIIQEV